MLKACQEILQSIKFITCVIIQKKKQSHTLIAYCEDSNDLATCNCAKKY